MVQCHIREPTPTVYGLLSCGRVKITCEHAGELQENQELHVQILGASRLPPCVAITIENRYQLLHEDCFSLMNEGKCFLS
mmetsp:Transcript_3109/g.5131  ORF Transcript_3109/g.5131 Transcript_3109/m.5131 type:complete len:80 (+) Transcript_3109:123-362(+)